MLRIFNSFTFETVRFRDRSRIRSESVAPINFNLLDTNDNTKYYQTGVHQFLVLDDVNIDSSLPLIGVFSKITQVQVIREKGCLGVTLRGGESTALVVTGIKPDGPAAKEGRIRLGDKLLAIDNIELQGLSLAEAHNALERCSDYSTASLTIEYHVARTDEIRTATPGPLLIELKRASPGELGLTVRDNANGVYIESLRPATAADRCGAIQAGDKLLAVDHFPIYDARTARRIMKNISKTYRLVRLQILPEISSVSTKTIMKRTKCQRVLGIDKTIYTNENLTVLLKSDHKGLGFVLKLSDDEMNYVIDHIEAGGPAERCGVLLPGDKILAMNGKILKNLHLNEITAFLESSQVELAIEYKVGGPAPPKSGIFTVRIFRPLGGQSKLGITMKEDLIISEVKRGSLVYRTGYLTPGDQLLAVNGQMLYSCDHLTVSHLIQLFENSTVDLTVRKSTILTNTRKLCFTKEEMQMKYQAEIFYTLFENFHSLDNSLDSTEEIKKMNSNISEIKKVWEAVSEDDVRLDSRTESYSSLQKNNRVYNKALQIMRIFLKKDLVYEDFGFSVSDGLYEKGIYVNRLRPGGPCDGILKFYDRILTINETNTKNYDCCLAVPLIATAGDDLNLIIARSMDFSI